LFGKATRRPWRTKTPANAISHVRQITKPGDCVSVDQLESTTLGLIAQLKGRPTVRRYRTATIFVDHFSGLSYVHLQKTTNAEDIVEAKEAFELFAASKGGQILHYHADNGRFADNRFRKAVMERRHTLSFCGVNAHLQNGMAERRIRELQDHSRTMLIHASKRWPSVIYTYTLAVRSPYGKRGSQLDPKDEEEADSDRAFSRSKASFNPKTATTLARPTQRHGGSRETRQVVRADQSGTFLGKVLAACKDRRPRSVSHDGSHLSAISFQV
jgi:hypothetical protein